jgi:ATP-dependent DNA helicase RecG
MPPREQLEALLADMESDRVERKASLSDPERIREAICAFANDLPNHRAPGYLFLGVDDRGQPTGLPITDQLLTTVADMRSDGNILPPPVMSVGQALLKGAPVVVVEVTPSDFPPVRLRGRTCIRTGPRRGVATLEEERRLTEKRALAVRTFDARACPDARLEDLLLEVFRTDYLPRVVSPEAVAQNQRSVEEQLASLSLYDLGRRAPTNAGVLVCGQDPLRFLPGAYVQFVRFDGATLGDPVKAQLEIGGNLLTQLTRLDDLLRSQIQTARIPGPGLRHEDQADYPWRALRELALNAVMHRDYEVSNAPARLYWFADRVEVQNPGGLYGQVTPENYERVCDYRNPLVAVAMKALGFVERFGTGIQRANLALRQNGNPPIAFHFEPTHVLATVRSRA